MTAQPSTSTRATRRVAMLAAAGIGAISMLAAIPADATPPSDSNVGLTVSTRAANPANPKLKLSRVSGNKLKVKAKTRDASSVLFKYRAKTGSYKKRTIRVTNNKAVTVLPKNTRIVKARAKGKRTSAWVTIPNVTSVAPIKNTENSNNGGSKTPDEDFFYGQNDWLYTSCNNEYQPITGGNTGYEEFGYNAVYANGRRADLAGGIGTEGQLTGSIFSGREMQPGEETMIIVYGPAKDRFKKLRYHQDPIPESYGGGIHPGLNGYYVYTGVTVSKSSVCPSTPVPNRPEY